MPRMFSILLIVLALAAALFAGYWGGSAFGLGPQAQPVATAPDDCQELQDELTAVKADIVELQDRLGESQTLVQELQVRLKSAKSDLSEAQGRLKQLGVLDNHAALGLARVLLDSLSAGDLEDAMELASGGEIEIYVEYADREDYGFASEDQELWNSVATWFASHKPVGAAEHFFLEGYSGFRNVVFELPDGFAWFQFSDDWALVKIRASLTDPRESNL